MLLIRILYLKCRQKYICGTAYATPQKVCDQHCNAKKVKKQDSKKLMPAKPWNLLQNTQNDSLCKIQSNKISRIIELSTMILVWRSKNIRVEPPKFELRSYHYTIKPDKTALKKQMPFEIFTNKTGFEHNFRWFKRKHRFKRVKRFEKKTSFLMNGCILTCRLHVQTR